MAISRQKKEAFVEQYKQDLDRSSAVFLTEYKGLSVNQMSTLRKALKEADGNYVVVKNTLALKVLSEAGYENIDELFTGPVGLSFSFGDPPPVAKALVDFAKQEDLFNLKGGFLQQKQLNAQEVQDLADLPPLDVIRAQLLGVIAAPASQIAGVVASGVRQVVNVIHAYSEKEDGEASAE